MKTKQIVSIVCLLTTLIPNSVLGKIYTEKSISLLSEFITSTNSHEEFTGFSTDSHSELNEAEKLNLLTTFNDFTHNFKLIKPDFKTDREVQLFLVNRMDIIQKRDITIPGNIPLYTSAHPQGMAFAIMATNGLEIYRLHEKEYMNELCSFFKVKDQELVNGIYYLLISDQSSLDQKFFNALFKQYYASRKWKKVQFTKEILLPYLTFIGNGIPLPEESTTTIVEAFNKLYKVQKSTNPLQTYITSFQGYCQGEVLDITDQIMVNELLKQENLYLQMSPGYCSLFEIVSRKTASPKSGELLLLERLPLSPPSFALGISTYSAPDVFVLNDKVAEEVDSIYSVITKETTISPKLKRVIGHWYQHTSPFLDKVPTPDSVYFNLLNREFANCSLDSIQNRVVRQVAIHELKHKWDEQYENGEARTVFDSEISAHLTELIYCENLDYSMIRFLQRMEGYSRYPGIDKYLDILLPQFWQLVRERYDNTLSVENAKKEIMEMYHAFSDHNGNKLSPLEEFGDIITSKILPNEQISANNR